MNLVLFQQTMNPEFRNRINVSGIDGNAPPLTARSAYPFDLADLVLRGRADDTNHRELAAFATV